jgi:N-formylglutamate deformylase
MPKISQSAFLKTVPPLNKFGVIFHVPHDSRVVPDAVRDQFLLEDAELEIELIRMTDHLTYDLVCGWSLAADIVRAPVSRLVVDVERFTNDSLESMSGIGMGAIYRVTHDLRHLRRALTTAERQSLIDRWYLPHHERLTNAVDQALEANNRALVIDIHSYSSQALPYEGVQAVPRPEICIGSDSVHTSTQLAENALNIFGEAGFTVGSNTPFSGALVPLKHYGKDKRVSAVMLEIRRDLYLNEETGKASDNYAQFKSTLEKCLSRLIQTNEAGIQLPTAINLGAQQ